MLKYLDEILSFVGSFIALLSELLILIVLPHIANIIVSSFKAREVCCLFLCNFVCVSLAVLFSFTSLVESICSFCRRSSTFRICNLYTLDIWKNLSGILFSSLAPEFPGSFISYANGDLAGGFVQSFALHRCLQV
jgi:hypothetical protein